MERICCTERSPKERGIASHHVEPDPAVYLDLLHRLGFRGRGVTRQYLAPIPSLVVPVDSAADHRRPGNGPGRVAQRLRVEQLAFTRD